ncbi:MAG: CvpA family protein [Treponema sp.]|jgi:membrane protein required for colicin V production|nr:CvpA family protein [Treponema sp.]
MTFAAIDVVFFIIIILFSLTAAAKGLVNEFFGKASLIGGLAVAVIFYTKLVPYVLKYVKNSVLAVVISFLLIFVVVYLIVRIIQQILNKIFSGEILRGLDHALGFLFGIVEGLVVVSFVLILMLSQPWINFDAVLKDSFFYSVLHSLVSRPVDMVQGKFA